MSKQIDAPLTSRWAYKNVFKRKVRERDWKWVLINFLGFQMDAYSNKYSI